MIQWNNEYNPNEITKKINEIVIRKNDGSISFHAIPHIEYISVLESMLSFDVTIPELEKKKIVRGAVDATAKKGKITRENLLQEINKRTKSFLELPKNSYSLISWLPITESKTSIPGFKWEDNKISFNPKLNNKFKSGITHIQRLAEFSSTKHNKSYMPVKINTNGRTLFEAFDNGVNTLDLFRGLWNLALNSEQSFRHTFGTPEPVNKIRPGLIHSLHFRNGDLATDSGWYDPDYLPAKPLDINSKLDLITKYSSKFLKKLNSSFYAKEIIDSIILYTRALDIADLSSSFIKLWSVLERLTNAEGAYSTLIRRAAFVFEDKEYYKQVLRHLRDYRNKYVHRAFDSNNIEVYLYQLKDITEVLISFHVGNQYGFKSIGDASEFLDLPVEKNILEKQLNFRRYAQKYLRYTK